MRSIATGFVAAAFFLVAMLAIAPAAPSATTARVAGGFAGAQAGLITHTVVLGESRQQLTVIDPELRAICVYHVDPTSGEIVLKSVRNFHWDLQMVEFNAANPLPREIRALVEQK